MPPPLIGITLCLDDLGRWRSGRRYLYVDQAYSCAVEAAGGRPLQLPIQAEPEPLVDLLDGLLLPGGDDFLPDTPYSEDVAFEPAPAEQIDFDRRVLGRALERGIPVLGICYGAQLLALQHGGRLHHHLPIDVPGSDPHQLPEANGRHPIRIEPDSRLASICCGPRPRDSDSQDRLEVDVNSLHHQAVADPGHGMRVCARSPDGVIEAIENPSSVFEIGVQWHPEKNDDGTGARLFRALVAASAAG